MKSKYFAEYSLGDEVKKDIGVLAELSEKTLDKLVEWIEKQKSYQHIDAADIKTLSVTTGESADTLYSAAHASEILLRRMGEFNDAPEDLLEDAVSLKILTKTSPELLAFLKRLAVRSKEYYLLSRTLFVAKGGIPNLRSQTMTVAVKPVYDKDFKYGTDDITKYAPSLVSSAIVAHISLAKGDCPQEFSFQVTKNSLDKLINSLLALQKQMILAEEKLKI